jgi:hypothetical protein
MRHYITSSPLLWLCTILYCDVFFLCKWGGHQGISNPIKDFWRDLKHRHSHKFRIPRQRNKFETSWRL